ncbi:MAG: sulfite oxidase-like oxidoreductase, partial [Verrucomicrobiales bacterium]|nr:sulfite oxidase-like oxidoreductase [Verrucomicrobiales bacterium]
MKEDFIRRKERWAKKMSTKERSIRTNAGRLPPGQHEVSNFPVLDLGVHPKIPLGDWQLKIHGEVENPTTLNWKQFMELPQFCDTSDFHCVTTW